MSRKILFVDDEQSIIESYKAIIKSLYDISKKDEFSSLYQDLFEDKKETEMINNLETDMIQLTPFYALQGEEAINIIKEHNNTNNKIEVVFLDMRMPPGMNGAETAKKIKEIDEDIEIVFVTAYSDIALGELSKILGRHDKFLFLKKPFSSDEIIQLAINLSEKYRIERIQERFISNVSHELKTPLSLILGFSNIIAKESSLDDETSELFEIIHHNSLLMKNLIDDLIQVSKFQESQTKINLVPTQLNNFINHIAKSFNYFKEKEILLKVELPENIITYDIDPFRITQCLYNLLSNAYKFSRNNSEVILKLEEDQNSISCIVIDNGQGIENNNLNLIFQKFFREENTSHEVEGLGLGLYITKEIVELHQGKLSCESKVNQGSTFKITFYK